MPTSVTTFGARVRVAATAAAIVAVFAAGPGTLIVPVALRLTTPIVCGSGARIEYRYVRYAHHGPGESSLEANCVGGPRTSRSVLLEAMLTLFVIYTVVLTPLIMWRSGTPPRKRTAPGAARPVVEHAPMPPPGAEPGDDPVAALRTLTEMVDRGLITGQEFERKKAEIMSRL